jgi:cellulose biosynthesis protein BcsQ
MDEISIIAFVSGKGGVGKTMLAVSAAREAARYRRTLLIDLDFFNRGLTGLIRGGTPSKTIAPPAFFSATESPLDNDNSSVALQWRLTELCPGLVSLLYPDITPTALRHLDSIENNELVARLREFILLAAKEAQCDLVILDCHGGPDCTSFAACSIANHALLVSEPDRITFYGTLNFVRQLRRASGAASNNLHLIFNKVIPEFSGVFLRRLYDAEIREEFRGRPLLAIFPLELYLMKAFEETTFLTDAFPNSWLARKTNLMLFDLTENNRKNSPPLCRYLPGIIRWWQRRVAGNDLPLLKLGRAFNIVAIVSFICLLCYALCSLTPATLVSKSGPSFKEAVLGLDVIEFYSQHTNMLIGSNTLVFLEEQRGVSTNQVDLVSVRREAMLTELSNEGSKETNSALTLFSGSLISIDEYNGYGAAFAERNRWLHLTKPNYDVPQALLKTWRQSLLELRGPPFRMAVYKYYIEKYAPVGMGAIFGWFTFVLILDWGKNIDRQFLFFSRIGKSWGKYCMLLVALIFLVILCCIGIGVYDGEKESIDTLPGIGCWLWCGMVLLGLLWLTVDQIRQIFRNLFVDIHYNEAFCRLVLLANVALLTLLGALARIKS